MDRNNRNLDNFLIDQNQSLGFQLFNGFTIYMYDADHWQLLINQYSYECEANLSKLFLGSNDEY